MIDFWIVADLVYLLYAKGKKVAQGKSNSNTRFMSIFKDLDNNIKRERKIHSPEPKASTEIASGGVIIMRVESNRKTVV